MDEKEEEETEVQGPKASLFPLLPVDASQGSELNPSVPHWLCNTSFTTDLSLIDNAVNSLHNLNATHLDRQEDDEEAENVGEPSKLVEPKKASPSYELLESAGSEGDSDIERREMKKRARKKKKRRRDGSEERVGFGDYVSRKSNVRAWTDTDTKPSKDYYFDARGDRDNLAFGSLYRMDVARYRPLHLEEVPGLNFRGSYRWNRGVSMLNFDGDIDSLDSKEKSGGRYWSAKYAALERHKNLKRVRINCPIKPLDTVPDDFIPLLYIQTSNEVGESWEDEVLRKTREFNKETREHPHDEKAWLAFAEFQDKVAATQTQKGARMQTLEKKISILEKAAELNPENEELLLCLLKAYQNRDSTEVLIGRWENVLKQNYWSYKLWREFLSVVQGEFSRFKVSEVRQMYAHAIQALSAACNKHLRQGQDGAKSSRDPDVQLELALVDVYLSLCRFEWQAGYQELATALLQAQIEFSLFCPSLLLGEHSKHRLFEHFWNSDGARIGEEGALGWSTWLEKEEENRQRVLREEAVDDTEKGGWTGWFQPLSEDKDTGKGAENINSIDEPINELETGLETVVSEFQEEIEEDDAMQEDDTEALMKMLGLDVDLGDSSDIKDTSSWKKWSEEELSRDGKQWMPIHGKSGGLFLDHQVLIPAKLNLIKQRVSFNEGMPDGEADEQLLRVVLYEDIKEYLFSLSSKEAQLSLILQFIDFFDGKISSGICSNSASWMEKMRALEALPDSMLQTLRGIHVLLSKGQSSSSSLALEFLLENPDDVSTRSDIMKFLRNAILLCLAAFPRNYILEEAALAAEELSVTKMHNCSCSVTPCRALAKSLLKSDRQDILLCGVYARREANYGNVDLARKVFDMALTSIEGLPSGERSYAPLLYFWYAEMELNVDPDNGHESSARATHLLACLGSGASYSPFKCQPSNLQLLRAHQGFKEKIRAVRSSWLRGEVDDPSIALMCSAALFEELTTGYTSALEVLDQAFSVVLPERRYQSCQLEHLFNYYVNLLRRHHRQLSHSKLEKAISQGMHTYPFNPEIVNSLVEINSLYTVPSKLRLAFDYHCQKQPSVVLWLFALSFEMSKGGSQHRIRGLFERALKNEKLCRSVVLWRCYIAYEIKVVRDPSAAKRIFFRAIHACPWSKKLWLDGYLKLNHVLSGKELSDLQEVMRDKELNLRTDIYEILLEDGLAS